MEEKMVSVKILGKVKQYPKGTTFAEIAKEYEGATRYPIVLVLEKGKLRELHKKPKENSTIEFITTADGIGHKSYKRSVCLLLLKAVYHVAGPERIRKVVIHFSVSSGYYFTVDGDVTVDQEFLDQVKKYMQEMVERKIPIKKRTLSTSDAIELFHKYGMYDKEKLFHYRIVSKVNLYSLEEFEDYFYGFMVNHTGYLKYFELYPYDEGFVLQLPEQSNPETVPPFQPEPKIFQVQKEANQWAAMMHTETVGDLNSQITHQGSNQLILIAEALQESKIAKIAEQIAQAGNKKIYYDRRSFFFRKDHIFTPAFHPAGCPWPAATSH